MKSLNLRTIRATVDGSFIWVPSVGKPCPMVKMVFIHPAFPFFPCYCKISPSGFEVGGYYSKEVSLTNSGRILPEDSRAPTEKQKNNDILDLHRVGKGLMFGMAVSSLFFLFYEDKKNTPSYFCNIPIPQNYNPNSPYKRYFNLCFLLPVASLPKAVGETFLVRLNQKTQIPLEVLFCNYVRCYTLVKRLSTAGLTLSATLLVYPIIYSIADIGVPIVLKHYGFSNKLFYYIIKTSVTFLMSGTVINTFVGALVWVLPKCSLVLLYLPSRIVSALKNK